MIIAWNGTEMALFRSMGPKGIQSNLFIWWQSEEKGHTAMSAGPQQAQALLLQMALKKKRDCLFSSLCTDCTAPHVFLQSNCGHKVLFLYSPWFPCPFSQCDIRTVLRSNFTLYQFRSDNIQEVWSYSHNAILWSNVFNIWSTLF